MASGRCRELSSLPGVGAAPDVTPYKEKKMPNASTSFFGWVAFLLQKYGMLFLRGTGMTLLIAHDRHRRWASRIGLLVAIIRTIALPETKTRRLRMRA